MRRYKWISPGLFRTMGNLLIAGRDVTWNDAYTAAPVALISETSRGTIGKIPPKPSAGEFAKHRKIRGERSSACG